MKRTLRVVWWVGMVMMLALGLASCQKHKTPTEPTDHSGPPTGLAHITGLVHDANGNPIANAFLHVTYQFTTNAKPASIETPSLTLFYTNQVLDTSCDSSVPLADGIMVHLFWDRNGNGPDAADQPPPLCADPPSCESGGPAYTVNFNEFPINGEAMATGAGTFYCGSYLVTYGDLLSPNRFYARIYCADGRALYTSQVVEPPAGPSDMEMTFDCSQCVGAPIKPQWSLDQSYPNPVLGDTAHVRFQLMQASAVLLTLHWTSSTRIDTLFSGEMTSGGHEVVIPFRATLPNGLYKVRLAATGFASDHWLLKNIDDPVVLRTSTSNASSIADGSFTLDAPAGTSIDQRDSQGRALGAATLSRVIVRAIRNGYAMADTTFTVESAGTYNLDLTMGAE